MSPRFVLPSYLARLVLSVLDRGADPDPATPLACLDTKYNANGRLYVGYCRFSVDATNRISGGGYILTPLDWARGRGHCSCAS
ncbi:hypothetical protein N7537_005675 [Penicillium hordei]|uniref:Uncharacterized protein n=1 Tax=Penicillium hordei TaxID=40994 RepID=A0AAD6E7F7_9EURO|nr:uncharacterized protein N7537_005675 [Penicillium hordei]KAJ5602719.1 hypothetical protein N7537_005675 [Penicillium hordei]